MSFKLMSDARPLRMPPAPKAVLMALADAANDHAAAWPSLATLVEWTCFSRRTVIDAIAWLENAGAITADRTNGRHTSYQLTLSNFDPNRCSSRTGAAAAPVQPSHGTGAAAARDRCSSRTGPVQQSHTNHQEPSITTIEPPVHARRSDSKPDADDPPILTPPLSLAVHEQPPPVAALPTRSGAVFEITGADAAVYESAYPEINVRREFARMAAWLDANPRKRPTAGGMKRFANGWLQRAADRAASEGARGYQSARVVAEPRLSLADAARKRHDAILGRAGDIAAGAVPLRVIDGSAS